MTLLTLLSSWGEASDEPAFEANTILGEVKNTDVGLYLHGSSEEEIDVGMYITHSSQRKNVINREN